ncbi:MAG: ribose-phosphate diphosphokinase [Euryarchaeota archaeon]|nr:ribose-phosphate diphosphokinase [Euryarchaeota archaeon]
MKVVAGPASPGLGARVAEQLGAPLLPLETRTFPDGEGYLRIHGAVEGEEVLVVQATPTAGDVVALLQLLDASAGARRRTVAIPYFGYARQDRQFQPGEAVSARAVARAIEADPVFTVNIHSPQALSHFRAPVQDLDAAPLLGERIRRMGLRDPIVIAPDDGAEGLARRTAGKGEWDVLEKKRLSATEVQIRPKECAIQGRDVVLVDDMVTTGGTIAEAARMLQRQGPRQVLVACVHPVLAGNALDKLHKAGVPRLITTDTLERPQAGPIPLEVASVAPLIAEAAKKRR